MNGPPLNPPWNPQGAVRPGSPVIGQGPPILEPPKLGADQYGGYTGLTKQTYDRTRLPPTDFWQAPSRKLTFLPLANPQPGVVGRAGWKPPVFDCRPDLKHAVAAPSEQAQPIWTDGRMGAGLCLYVFINNVSLITESMRVYSIQFGHPYDATRALNDPLQQPQDISTDFFDGAAGVILRWALPGYRFWRLNLRFDQLSGTINELGAPLSIQAAVY